MVKHVILWTLKDRCFGPDLGKIKSDIKNELEGLNGQIEGMKELKIITECLSSSNADIMLDSIFEDEAALKAYASNPLHKSVANTYVIPFVETRTCIDFEC